MKGIVETLKTSAKSGLEYGFIRLTSGELIFFNSRSLSPDYEMSDFFEEDNVEFSSIGNNRFGKKYAIGVKVIKTHNCYEYQKNENSHKIKDFYTPGYFKSLNRIQMRKEHLKCNSGEYEVLQKLQRILYISHVGHHEMGKPDAIFPFCLIGATEFLKAFLHGKYEFLLIFSHFDDCSWQQNTLKAANFIRKRKEISERRPLVNFYILISNARNLKNEIDKMKGGTEAAIIPFSFEEILSCNNKKQLEDLFIERFGEYLFENNMLGEENPIEDEQLLFGDRGKIADSIVQRSKEGKHSGIFGLRRSGKSSVLRAVTRRLDYADIKYIVIEARSALENTNSWKTALFDIAKQIRIVTTGLIQGDDETRHDFQKKIKFIQYRI